MYQWKQTGVSVIRLLDGEVFPRERERTNWLTFPMWAQYDEWRAQGNEPLAEAPPIDLSDVDSLERSLKAIMMCVAEVGGLTNQQARALFKQKYDQLG